MNWIAAILFVVGVTLAALGVTYVENDVLLLAGIIITGAGLLLSNLFKEY